MKTKTESMVEYKTFPFEVKEADGKTGTIRGYASTFGNVDQGGDVVMPGAFAVTIKQRKGLFKILADHIPSQQIGWNKEAEEDTKGLLVMGLLDIAANQKAREKHSMAKMGFDLAAEAGVPAEIGLSIGYEPIQYDFLQTDGMVTSGRTWKQGEVRRLKEIRLWEYSLVTFPMNEEALLTGAKSWLHDVTNRDTLEDSMKMFLETMRGKSYSDNQIRKALLEVTPKAAVTEKDPELDLQSLSAILDNIQKTLRLP